MFSSKSFRVSGLVSRSLIHVEFIFVFRVSFAVQKLLSLVRSHLFIFVFIVMTLRGGSEKMLLSFKSESVWPMFSSKSFIVSFLFFFFYGILCYVKSCKFDYILFVYFLFYFYCLGRLT